MDLQKLATEIRGRDALEERFGSPRLRAVDEVLLLKAASADQELLEVAAGLGTGDTLEMYEKLGGKYAQTGDQGEKL